MSLVDSSAVGSSEFVRMLPWQRPYDIRLAGRRVQAHFTDTVITFPLLLFMVFPSPWLRAVFPLLHFAYEGVCIGLWSQTVGARSAGIRIVASRAGGTPGLWRGFARPAPYGVPGVLVNLWPGEPLAAVAYWFALGFFVADGLLWLVILGPRGSSLHDLVADTVVIRDEP